MAKLKHNAFTIIELLVAMGLLVMLLTLSGLVFSTTVEAHRKAGASIDISRNLRAVTDQLNSDFRGLRKDAPLFIWFNAVDADGDLVPDTHYDTIHFFADGDFQTMRQYFDGTANKTVYGNLARLYYGHSNTPGITDYAAAGLLARKAHILTSDADIKTNYTEIPCISNWPIVPSVVNYGLFSTSFGTSNYIPANLYTDENTLEFNTITLSEWINVLNTSTANADRFITYCMTDIYRPQIDLEDSNTLHLLLSQGVLQMQIQWAYTADDLVTPGMFTGIRWWPNIDPNGDGKPSDSDLAIMNAGNPFGVYFTLPAGTTKTDWFAIQNCGTLGVAFKSAFYPKALKFTFVLRDSNGLFVDGKTFTHIVYLDN